MYKSDGSSLNQGVDEVLELGELDDLVEATLDLAPREPQHESR